MRILLVEDEKQLSDALKELLEKNKYTVDAVYQGDDGLNYALSGIYDIIILDVMLPKQNGIDVLRALRQAKNTTPVILLTALGEVSDKVRGLDAGADDYLAKPFAPAELLARLRALSRRPGELLDNNCLQYRDIILNLTTYELQGPLGSLRLSLKEYEICRFFLQRAEQVVDKNELISKVWGYNSEVEYNNLEVYISMLRKKLQYLGSVLAISAVRGVGYRLEVSHVS